MEDQKIKRIIEALIFASDAPLPADRIKEALEESNGLDVDAVVNSLNDEYAASGRAFAIQKVAGGYHLSTLPEYASWIRRLYLGRHKSRLTQPALETLAIVAFKQPISRIEVAQIRGVDPDAVLRNLLERRLVTISGRSEGLGRPLLYSTTPEFLQYFGLDDLSQLPKPREIEDLFGKGEYSEELLEALSQTEVPGAPPNPPLPVAEAASTSEMTTERPVDSSAATDNEQKSTLPTSAGGGSDAPERHHADGDNEAE